MISKSNSQAVNVITREKSEPLNDLDITHFVFGEAERIHYGNRIDLAASSGSIGEYFHDAIEPCILDDFGPAQPRILQRYHSQRQNVQRIDVVGVGELGE